MKNQILSPASRGSPPVSGTSPREREEWSFPFCSPDRRRHKCKRGFQKQVTFLSREKHLSDSSAVTVRTWQNPRCSRNARMSSLTLESLQERFATLRRIICKPGACVSLPAAVVCPVYREAKEDGTAPPRIHIRSTNRIAWGS